MCGIIGFTGSHAAVPVIIEGLKKLEYRGYDSAGVAVIDDGAVLTEKKAGKLANLEKALAERTREQPGLRQAGRFLQRGGG